MPARKKRGSRKAPVSLWDNLNEPVIEVSPQFAKRLFLAAVLFLFAAWIAPYWGQAETAQAYSSRVAGAYTDDTQSWLVERPAGVETPQWYEVSKALPGDLTEAFAVAAAEVLDASEPVGEIAQFYQPGFAALNDAWLELMADPPLSAY